MSKKIKLSNETFLDTSSVIHNNELLSNIIDLRGSTAVFYKNDNQNIPKQTYTQIKFNKTKFVDNGCFELQSNGEIKVLKDISRVLVTTNIRTDVNGGIIYVNGTGGGFNIDTYSAVANGSGTLEVTKNSTIKISTYRYTDGTIQGYDRNWCGVTVTVLK